MSLIVNRIAKMRGWLVSVEKVQCGSVFPADTNHTLLRSLKRPQNLQTVNNYHKFEFRCQWKSNVSLKMSWLQKFTAYLSFRDTRTCSYFYLQSLELTTCFFLLQIDPYNWTGTNAVLSGKKMWKVKYERLLQKGLSFLSCIYKCRGDFQFAIKYI